MREYVNNERGNSIFFILWLLSIVAVVFLIVANIAKVYVVQAQANSAVEQAAFAGTSVMITETTKTIEEFDRNLVLSATQKLLDGNKTIMEQVEENQQQFIQSGMLSDQAYISALNEILPEKLSDHVELEILFRSNFDSSFVSEIKSSAGIIIEDNGGNIEDTTVKFSSADVRIEVQSTVTFESIADNEIILLFQDTIPQKGYGPKLYYMDQVDFSF